MIQPVSVPDCSPNQVSQNPGIWTRSIMVKLPGDADCQPKGSPLAGTPGLRQGVSFELWRQLPTRLQEAKEFCSQSFRGPAPRGHGFQIAL